MTEKYGSAPVYCFDEQKRKEWEDMDPQVKKSVERHLHTFCRDSSLKVSIEVLSHLYLDLSKRIDKLEEANDRNNQD